MCEWIERLGREKHFTLFIEGLIVRRCLTYTFNIKNW